MNATLNKRRKKESEKETGRQTETENIEKGPELGK